jgi:hypothetical protein
MHEHSGRETVASDWWPVIRLHPCCEIFPTPRGMGSLTGAKRKPARDCSDYALLILRKHIPLKQAHPPTKAGITIGFRPSAIRCVFGYGDARILSPPDLRLGLDDRYPVLLLRVVVPGHQSSLWYLYWYRGWVPGVPKIAEACPKAQVRFADYPSK